MFQNLGFPSSVKLDHLEGFYRFQAPFKNTVPSQIRENIRETSKPTLTSLLSKRPLSAEYLLQVWQRSSNSGDVQVEAPASGE